MGLKAWIKKHILRRQSKLEEEIREYDEKWLDNLKVKRTRVPKPGHQATRQDIGRFMKHGRQSKEYRRSVKAKKQPTEED